MEAEPAESRWTVAALVIVMRMSSRSVWLTLIAVGSLSLLTALVTTSDAEERFSPERSEASVFGHALRSIAEGKSTFRFETFGDEVFWGDTLKLHEAIAGAANGGVGPGLSPSLALWQLGLKVDSEALPGLVEERHSPRPRRPR